MKICYLTHNIDPKNGWGRYASDLILGVENLGHKVTILKEANDELGGVPILHRGLRLFLSAYKARKYIKECDVVHALDGYPYGIIAALANMGLGKKLIISGVGTYSVEPLYNLKSGLLKWAYGKADRITCISRYTESQILKKVKLNNTVVINPGINLGSFYRTRIESSEDFIVGVGALKHRKGYHISIPAFALVKKEFPNLRYKIIGSQKDKKYFDQLLMLADKYGLKNDIDFLENVSDQDLGGLYARARAFVLTSVNQTHHFEGYGLVFLEASAAGLPVVGTQGNGIEDSVKNGYNGFLVPQNDITATAKAILDVLRVNWQELSQNSYQWAEEHSAEKAVEEYMKIYNE